MNGTQFLEWFIDYMDLIIFVIDKWVEPKRNINEKHVSIFRKINKRVKY